MKYYTCANTSLGVRDFTSDNVFDVEDVIELKCSNPYITHEVLSRFMGEVPEAFDEIIHVGYENLRSGIVFANRKFAVVSCFDGATVKINLDELLGVHKKEEFPTMPPMMESAYKEAKSLHDDWEKIYIGHMDFERLNLYCQSVISEIVPHKKGNGTSKIRKRFFGTTTCNGPVNFIDDITANIKDRYFIKGRPGTGKSTFLKKLSAELSKKDFDIVLYYCSFDPESLDMVACEELSLCVFDSTSPHEKFPEREGDVILDFYTESGLSGIDEKFSSELSRVKNAYSAKIREGNEAFKDYTNAMCKKYEESFKSIKEKDILSAVDILKKSAV